MGNSSYKHTKNRKEIEGPLYGRYASRDPEIIADVERMRQQGALRTPKYRLHPLDDGMVGMTVPGSCFQNPEEQRMMYGFTPPPDPFRFVGMRNPPVVSPSSWLDVQLGSIMGLDGAAVDGIVGPLPGSVAAARRTANCHRAQMEKQVKGIFRKKTTNYELNVGTKAVMMQRPVRKSRKSKRKEN